jgi:hypothetical protein
VPPSDISGRWNSSSENFWTSSANIKKVKKNFPVRRFRKGMRFLELLRILRALKEKRGYMGIRENKGYKGFREVASQGT